MESSSTGLTTPAPSTARARYASGERRREQILVAAMEVFAEQGLTATSLRAIAVRAGTSHLNLIHHFGSKEVLYRRVLERRSELDRAARMAVPPGSDLATIAAVMMGRNAATPGIVQLDTVIIAEAIEPSHPAHDFIRERQDDFVAEVIATLALEREAGRVRDGLDHAVIARQLTALVGGLQAQRLYDADIDVEHHIREFLRLLEP